MNTYYYSASKNAFFVGGMKDDYQKAGTWPDDGIFITQEKHRELMAGKSAGKIITPDENGYPVLTIPDIDWQERAEATRKKLLSDANNLTADWRTELMLGTLPDDDKVSLTAWMGYIRELKALDLTGVTDEESCNAVAWPDKPE